MHETQQFNFAYFGSEKSKAQSVEQKIWGIFYQASFCFGSSSQPEEKQRPGYLASSYCKQMSDIRLQSIVDVHTYMYRQIFMIISENYFAYTLFSEVNNKNCFLKFHKVGNKQKKSSLSITFSGHQSQQYKLQVVSCVDCNHFMVSINMAHKSNFGPKLPN